MQIEKSLEIFTATSGYPSARVIIKEQQTVHLHSTVHPEKEATYFNTLSFWGDTIVFLGIGIGYHLLDKINELSPQANIIIVDNFEELTINAEKELFSNQTNPVKKISQNNSDSEISKIIDNISGTVQFIKHSASFSVDPIFYNNIKTKITYRQKQDFKNSTGKTKRILILKHQFFLESEVKRALEGMGNVEISEFEYGKISSSYEYEDRLLKEINANRPDLIISINMKGFDGDGSLSEYSNQFGIPVAVWFVDDPHPILLHQSQFIKSNIIAFCWERRYFNFLKKLDFASIHYLPLATDLSIFKNKSISPKYELGFIGSSMGEVFLHSIKNKFLWDNNLTELCELSSNFLLNNSDNSITNIIKENIQKLNINLPFSDTRNITWLYSYIIHLTSMKKRINIISAFKSRDFDIFGDPEGWKNILKSGFTFHKNIDYKNSLCSSYQNIKINLNITSSQMSTAVNQRVFDIPASGSFVISDNQKDLGELFEIGKEAIVYGNIEDLKDKIIFYKNNDNIRNKISQNALLRINNEHTYNNRIATIFKHIFK